MNPKLTRIIALTLAAGAALFVAGCSSSDEESMDTDKDTDTTTTAPADD